MDNFTEKQQCYDVCFMTALESTSLSGLQATQVMETAFALSRAGYRVYWLASVPALDYVRDLLFAKRHLANLTARCSQSGVIFRYLVLPLRKIDRLQSFLFRTPVFRWAARRLASMFVGLVPGRQVVFHARSYYATQLALELRDLAPHGSHWQVSFDMRSVFPEELPLVKGMLGTLLYGYLKRWEFDLVRRADAAFLPLEYARYRSEAESGLEIIYAPIQGFDREAGWAADFEERFARKLVGYAGTLGDWNDPFLLKEMLSALPGCTPHLAVNPHPVLAEYDCRSYRHDAMPSYYDDLLALVIPGRKDCFDYFVRLKMRCNFFSTKAAEALSRGVPLIVSSLLAELADFVRTHECGAIYDPDEKRFVYPEGEWLDNKEVWRSMTARAAEVGQIFTRSAVLDHYIAEWNELFTASRERVDV